MLAPMLGLIVFCGVYPKPMLDRIQPSVDALIVHIEDRTGYVQPQPVLFEGGGEHADEPAEDHEEEGE